MTSAPPPGTTTLAQFAEEHGRPASTARNSWRPRPDFPEPVGRGPRGVDYFDKTDLAAFVRDHPELFGAGPASVTLPDHLPPDHRATLSRTAELLGVGTSLYQYADALARHRDDQGRYPVGAVVDFLNDRPGSGRHAASRAPVPAADPADVDRLLRDATTAGRTLTPDDVATTLEVPPAVAHQALADSVARLATHLDLHSLREIAHDPSTPLTGTTPESRYVQLKRLVARHRPTPIVRRGRSTLLYRAADVTGPLTPTPADGHHDAPTQRPR